METIFQKGGVHHCQFCLSNEGVVARVFPSKDAFMESDFATGYDSIKGDPNAQVAAWPGKNNISFKEPDWTLCCPVHPMCGHCWQEFYGVDHQFDDWYGRLDIDKLIKKHTKNT